MPPTPAHYVFALGERDGSPSYAILTKSGLRWLNVDPDLEAVIKSMESSEDVLDIELGEGGRFYVKWREGQSVRTKLSDGLSQELGSKPSHDLDRLSLGKKNWHWGISVYNGAQHQMSNSSPGFRSNFLGSTRRLKSFHDVKFVALGSHEQWAYNVNGTVKYASRNEEFKAAMRKALTSGKEVTGVTFSPTDKDWLIILNDGTVHHSLKDYIAAQVDSHMVPGQSLLSQPLRKQQPIKEPPLKPLSSTSAEYRRIVTLFRGGWLHPHKARPDVLHIYSIKTPAPNEYLQYKRRLTAVTAVKDLDERCLFHGTKRDCHLGDPDHTTELCQSSSCSLCSILRSSFKVSRAGTAPDRNFLRFGPGIYTSSVSSKADDYSITLPGGQYQALIVARVLLGEGYGKYTTDQSLRSPPQGYHSIIGRVGVDLNYDEQVVFDDDAIRPGYLIIYKP